MPNPTIAVLGPPDFARGLGKKGTTSDITLYNLKRGKRGAWVFRGDDAPEGEVLASLPPIRGFWKM